MIEVSIIIPIYNSEKYLRTCLDSLINQTFEKIEIILVNDGSKDESLKIMNEYKAKDKRIKIISQENQGQGEARNNGIKIACGKYITFVDSDDWIAEDHIENLYEMAVNNNADISVCNMVMVREKDLKNIKLEMFTIKEMIGEDAVKELLLDKQLKSYPCGKLYKKIIFIENNIFFPQKMFYEDLAIILQAFFFSNKVVFSNNYSYFYLQNSNSSTRNPNINNLWDRLKALNMIKTFFIEKNVFDKYKYNYKHLCLFHLYLLVNQIDNWNLNIKFNEVIRPILILIEEETLSAKIINNTQLDNKIKKDLILLCKNQCLYKCYWLVRKFMRNIKNNIK
ncbi:glycosyltransferase family 2 protein [Clostridium sp. OS1-26]|uniref:glycosyltransferase family 2 protein n=1 Tax=Clostridium sp. OS1-26 TaxID=3070681 RepID=UPI0027E09D8C|nr:glycosyltransferase family 2 protein [Clostridium sp. OS1-26]WML36801.1 glycosyltransferase family 2 protein [Clostridium sp. OS1-26]